MPNLPHRVTVLLAALGLWLPPAMSARAAPIVVDFEIFGTAKGLRAYSGNHSDGAVTLSPLGGHFDVAIDRGLQSSGRTAIGLHNGGNGSGIRLAFAETLMALSIDVPAWIIANSGAPDATVTSSAGGSFVIGFGTTGVWDLSMQAGFDAVDWIEVRMPDPNDTCVFFSNGRSLNCSTMFLDRLVIDTDPPLPVPVPVPASFPLAVGGIAMLGLAGRRLRAKR